jgi:hypothetical protein
MALGSPTCPPGDHSRPKVARSRIKPSSTVPERQFALSSLSTPAPKYTRAACHRGPAATIPGPDNEIRPKRAAQ